MMPIEIYYSPYNDPDCDETRVITTEKSYWEQHHTIDDGSTDHYNKMVETFTDAGAEEAGSSKFILYEPLEKVMRYMDAHGFHMVRNDNIQTC